MTREEAAWIVLGLIMVAMMRPYWWPPKRKPDDEAAFADAERREAKNERD